MAHASIIGRHRSGRLAVWACAAALMVVPLLVIRAVEGQEWDLPGDLVFLAILLAGIGAAYEVAMLTPVRLAYRAGVIIALAAALFQAWINLAVGIIGSEDNPANMIYAGVLAVAAAGAAVARLGAPGMVKAMVAAAVAQVLAFLIVFAAGLGFTGPITVFFTALWLASAMLFKRSAEFSVGADPALN